MDGMGYESVVNNYTGDGLEIQLTQPRLLFYLNISLLCFSNPQVVIHHRISEASTAICFEPQFPREPPTYPWKTHPRLFPNESKWKEFLHKLLVGCLGYGGKISLDKIIRRNLPAPIDPIRHRSLLDPFAEGYRTLQEGPPLVIR